MYNFFFFLKIHSSTRIQYLCYIANIVYIIYRCMVFEYNASPFVFQLFPNVIIITIILY